MLNKLLQKTRNAKFDSSIATTTKTQTQSVNVGIKQSIDLQKDNIPFSSTNSATLVSSQLSNGQSQAQTKSPGITSIPSSITYQSSPIANSLSTSNASIQTPSQLVSSRTQVSALSNNNNNNNNYLNSAYILQNSKQRSSIQVSQSAKQGLEVGKQQLDAAKQGLEVAQENSQVTTPHPIKYKSFDLQNLSIQRVAVNLNNMDEFKELDQKTQFPSSQEHNKREQEYQNKIDKLQNQITLLVQELEKQTSLSNQALEDNSLLRKKYQEVKDSAQKQHSLYCRSDSIASSTTTSAQQDLLSTMQVFEIQEENKKIRQRFSLAQQEVQQWRKKYENLEKQQEQHEDILKERLSDQYSNEIQALNNELIKYKSSSFGINKTKKTSLLRSSNNNNNNNNNLNNTNNLLKENTNKSNIAQTYTDDWHQNYMLMKDEKEKAERMLKKRIESLEEQNAFLQNEVNQQHLKQDQLSVKELSAEPNFVNKQPFNKNNNNDPQFQNRKSNNLQELNYYFSQNLN